MHLWKQLQSNFLKKGVSVPSLNRKKKWDFKPTAKVGDEVISWSMLLEQFKKQLVVEQKIMIPIGVEGKIKEIKDGEFTVTETICVVETANGDKEVTLMQKWPVRKGRPYASKNKSS